MNWKRSIGRSSSNKIVIIVASRAYPDQTGLNLDDVRANDAVDTFIIKFYSGNERSWFETSKCHKGSIDFLDYKQNEIRVQDLTKYSTKLLDFMSLCYDVDTFGSTLFDNECANGNLINNTCFCNMGFRGKRCHFSNLAELDCYPGVAKFGKNYEAICHCPTTAGGLKYCGVNPCTGSCSICARHRDGTKCDNNIVQSDIFSEIFHDYIKFDSSWVSKIHSGHFKNQKD